MQCSSVNQAHPPGNCTFPHSTCNHASRSAAFFTVFMLLLFKFAISNSPKIGNLALTFPIACGKLINADEAACLISLDADIAQLVERLIRNHQVKGSSPFIGSIFYRGVAQFGSAFGSGPKGRRFKSCHLDHIKYQLLIQRLVLFFYPMVAQKPLLQGLSLTFSRKGILRQIYFSLRKQARKEKSLSAPVLFTPPRSKWRILEFCQIVCLGLL